MGNFARYMMRNVCLRDAVRDTCTNPTHDLPTISEEVAVQSGKCTSGEGEFGSTVVWQKWVGVLKEGDEDEPVVHPTMNRDQRFVWRI